MSTLNEETKNKASILQINVSYCFHSSSRGAFPEKNENSKIRYASKVEFLLQKWLTIFSR